MKKRILATAAILTLSLQVTGCGAINLTSQEKNVIAEYIANILLKHDKTYEPTLQYAVEEEMAEEEEEEEQPQEEEQTEETNQEETKQEETTTSSDGNTDSQSNDEEKRVSVSSIYKSGLNLTCSNVSFYQTYPKNEKAVLPLEASSGNTVCVVTVKIKNTTKTQKKIDLLMKNYSYKLEVNGNKTYSAMQSMLVDDVQYLDTTLKAGKSCNAVVAFEVPKSAKKKKLNLLITKDSKTASVKIK